MVVDNLVKVGANLGGSDLDGGFAILAFQSTLHTADKNAIRTWTKAGMKMPFEQDKATGLSVADTQVEGKTSGASGSGKT